MLSFAARMLNNESVSPKLGKPSWESPTGTPSVPGARVRVRNTFIEATAEADSDEEYCFTQFTHCRSRSCPNPPPIHISDVELAEPAPEESPGPKSEHFGGEGQAFEGVLSQAGSEEAAVADSKKRKDNFELGIRKQQEQDDLNLGPTVADMYGSADLKQGPHSPLSCRQDNATQFAPEGEPVPEPPCDENGVHSFREPCDTMAIQFSTRPRRSRGGQKNRKSGTQQRHEQDPNSAETSVGSRGSRSDPLFAPLPSPNPHQPGFSAAASADDVAEVVGAANEELSNAPSKKGSKRLAKSRPGGANKLWCQIYIDEKMAELKEFDLVPKLIGAGGRNTRDIWDQTQAKVRVRGRGSGHLEQKTDREADAHLQIAITADHGKPEKFRKAVDMAKNLLEQVSERFDKFCRGRGFPTSDAVRFWIGEVSEEAKICLADADLPTAPRVSVHTNSHNEQRRTSYNGGEQRRNNHAGAGQRRVPQNAVTTARAGSGKH